MNKIAIDNSKESNTLGNIFHMCNAAAMRVYQLRRGMLPKVKPENSHMETALKEIQSGKLGLGILLTEIPMREQLEKNKRKQENL